MKTFNMNCDSLSNKATDQLYIIGMSSHYASSTSQAINFIAVDCSPKNSIFFLKHCST